MRSLVDIVEDAVLRVHHTTISEESITMTNRSKTYVIRQYLIGSDLPKRKGPVPGFVTIQGRVIASLLTSHRDDSNAFRAVNHMMKTVNDRYKPHIKILLDKLREDDKPFSESTHELYVYLVERVPDPRVSTPPTHLVDSADDEEGLYSISTQLQTSFTGRPTVCFHQMVSKEKVHQMKPKTKEKAQ